MKFLVAVFAFLLVISSCETPTTNEKIVGVKDSVIVREPIIEYGFVLDSFQVIRDTVQKNWTLSHLLAPYGVSQFNINQSADIAADSTVGLKYISVGKPFIILA